jgi:hypothetical protein
MGNQCACTREKLDEQKVSMKEKYNEYSAKAKVKYGEIKVKANEKLDEAKVKYAPQLEQARKKYNETKLRVKGYTVVKVDDKSETGMITNIEYNLPLAKIDLDDFERRLKKLAEPNTGHQVTAQ